MNLALMGAGSLGTIIGAMLAHSGMDITLIDANVAHIDALNKNGASVTGKIKLSGVPVKAITPREMTGVYDSVILLAKQTFNAVALGQLLPHLGPDSVICTLQNGIPEESVAAVVGAERTVGGVVGWGATWRGPGVSEMTSDVVAMHYDIGELDGSRTARIETIASLLNHAGTCTVVSNLMGIRWSKIAQNATLSGLSAALGATYAQVLDDDKATAWAAHVGNEIVQIVRRRNIILEDLVPGRSYYSLEFENQAGLERAMAWLRDYFKPHRLLKASMLQDMEKGIPCEIDFIVGVCSQWGTRLGIPTPACDAIVKIVKDFEAGKIPMPTMACLSRFTLPALR